MTGSGVVTAIDVSVLATTFSVVVPKTAPRSARILAIPITHAVVPAPHDLASPLEPSTLLMVAIIVGAIGVFGVLDQVTDDVRSCEVRSAKFPVAVNC